MCALMRWLRVAAFLALLGCASEHPDMRARFDEQERFGIFRGRLIEAGREMGVVAKEGAGPKGLLIPVRDETLSLAEPLEVVRLPSIVVEGTTPMVQYAIRIAPDFLRRATDAYLKFGAAHEICHLKLGHVHAKGPMAHQAQEAEANGCACEYVGKASCIEVHRYLDRLLGTRTFERLSDEAMERHLVGVYRIARFERP